MTKKAKTIDDAELRLIGIDALNKALGPVKTLRLLALFHHEPADYVQISRRLYENQSTEEIFQRTKWQWRG
jgi:regulator of PEP synthase PpsR (kinase-PPPase family)